MDCLRPEEQETGGCKSRRCASNSLPSELKSWWTVTKLSRSKQFKKCMPAPLFYSIWWVWRRFLSFSRMFVGVKSLLTVVSCRSRIKIDVSMWEKPSDQMVNATFLVWLRWFKKEEQCTFKSINNIWAQLVPLCVLYWWRTEKMKEHVVCVVVSYESSKNLIGLFSSSCAGPLWWKWMRWGSQICHYATDK